MSLRKSWVIATLAMVAGAWMNLGAAPHATAAAPGATSHSAVAPTPKKKDHQKIDATFIAPKKKDDKKSDAMLAAAPKKKDDKKADTLLTAAPKKKSDKKSSALLALAPKKKDGKKSGALLIAMARKKCHRGYTDVALLA